MQDFVQRVLRSRIDGPVVDETRLLGRYDLVLTTGLPPAEPTTLTVLLRTNIALFEAMKAQLGLELKSAKVPMPTLIIQDATRPVED
jgi:uncharacterized protein (TIGR03435 family)